MFFEIDESDNVSDCPFCGGRPLISQKGNDRTRSRSTTIKCRPCNVQMTHGAIRNSMEWTKKVTIEYWNSRAAAVPGETP